MAAKTKSFEVAAVTDSESEIVAENKGRIMLFIRNRGSKSVYIGNKESFNINTESLELLPGLAHIWEGNSILSNAIYAKCASSETSSVEIEEMG